MERIARKRRRRRPNKYGFGPDIIRIRRYTDRPLAVQYLDPNTRQQREQCLYTHDMGEAIEAVRRFEKELYLGPDIIIPGPNDFPKALRNDNKGVIYFIEAIGLALVKIGWSARPVPRIQQINSTSPVPTHLLGMTIGTRADERSIHEAFRSCHHRFEWFMLTKPLREYIGEHSIYVGGDDEWTTVAESLALQAAGVCVNSVRMGTNN